MTSIGRTVSALIACAALITTSRPAAAQLCYTDSCLSEKAGCDTPEKGVRVRWLQDTVDVYINVPDGAKLPADKTAVENAVKAAFQAYQDVPCSTLKFDFKGVMDPLSIHGLPGTLLVFFGHNSETWIWGNAGYNYGMNWTQLEKGDIEQGVIALNANHSDFGWTIGAEAKKIDIQTAVTKLLPGVLGFYVGNDPGGGSVDLRYNEVAHDLTQDHITGVQYAYHDAADAACQEPAKPAHCDPGLTVDAGPSTDDAGPNIGKSDGGGTTGKLDAGPGTVGGNDSGTVVGGESDDDGCCRVSYLRESDVPVLLLLGFGLVLRLSRRKRRVRPNRR